MAGTIVPCSRIAEHEPAHGSLKPRVAFPSEDAALKVMYLALRNVIRKWKRLIHWKAALNCFTQLWEDRIEAAIGK